jgi:chemotaxis protein MotB
VLLGLIFVFMIVLVAQIILAREMTDKDGVLRRLDADHGAAKARLAEERTSLLARVATAEKANAETTERAATTFLGLNEQLEAEKRAGAAARAEADSSRGEVVTSRQKITELEGALTRAETEARIAGARSTDLSERLDAALAETNRPLDRYRSDFCGRLQEILGDRQGIRIAGDRFVVQAEVLFASGRATLDPAGRAELDKIAAALIELDKVIPSDIHWVLRVDGHTDKKPIVSRNFTSNWALSSARATAVVHYLIGKGVPPQRLAAAGFAEYHPIESGEGEEVNRRNRRIELKITEK